MDEPLKARLIGATILVLLAVVLVPELLSGPKRGQAPAVAVDGSRGTRTYTIDLGGAVASGAKLEPGAAAPAAQSTPALPIVQPKATTSTAPDAANQDDQPIVVPAPIAKPDARPAPGEPEPKPLPAAKGGFSVQVGAFGSEASAHKLVDELHGAGFPAYISPVTKSGKTLHRVRVGPAVDRAEADALARRLAARHLPVSVVAGG